MTHARADGGGNGIQFRIRRIDPLRFRPHFHHWGQELHPGVGIGDGFRANAKGLPRDLINALGKVLIESTQALRDLGEGLHNVGP